MYNSLNGLFLSKKKKLVNITIYRYKLLFTVVIIIEIKECNVSILKVNIKQTKNKILKILILTKYYFGKIFYFYDRDRNPSSSESYKYLYTYFLRILTNI